MLRSRSVSWRRVLSSVVSLTVVVLSLFVTSPALAGPPVIVAGPDGSARMTAIVAELRARGFDVVLEGAGGAAPKAASPIATVRVGSDGSVHVAAGLMREVFPATDSDAVLARRVAEAVRAADAETAERPEVALPPPPPPPDSPPAASAPAPAPPPAAPPPPVVTELLSPSRAFALRGAWLLSVDDALPLVAFGGAAPLSTERMLRIGDPTYGARTSPKPMSLDVAVADRVTVGGSLLLQYGLSSSILGGAVRLGYVIPIGDRLALWPRLGVAHESSLDDGDWAQSSRTDVVAEARLVWTVTTSWALTFGPSVALAVQSKRYEAKPETNGYVSYAPLTYPANAPARVGVAVGITGHLDQVADDEHAAVEKDTRVFLGVARALPLFRYRVDTAVTGKSRKGRESEGPPARADGGTVDATSIVPQAPVLSVDVQVGKHVTLGASGSIGVVQFTQLADELIPPETAVSTVAWTISPRVGWRAEASRSFAFWPRVGLTYVNASSGEELAYHLGVDAEAFAVFSPVRGVGLLFGPSLGLPITGARTINDTATAATTTSRALKRQEQSVISVGLTGGLVVELP